MEQNGLFELRPSMISFLGTGTTRTLSELEATLLLTFGIVILMKQLTIVDSENCWRALQQYEKRGLARDLSLVTLRGNQQSVFPCAIHHLLNVICRPFILSASIPKAAQVEACSSVVKAILRLFFLTFAKMFKS